jgi:predicted enzyme related to lactoylglutathione lyase
MHKADVVQFEISGEDTAELKRFYASLFGWHIQAEETSPGGPYSVAANGDGIRGIINTVRGGRSGQVTFYIEVDDVMESLAYAEELGGTIIRRPHEIVHQGGPATVASFSDPAGNVVGLSTGLAPRRTLMERRPDSAEAYSSHEKAREAAA